MFIICTMMEHLNTSYILKHLLYSEISHEISSNIELLHLRDNKSIEK